MQQLNKQDSYALMEEGVVEGGEALIASAINYAIDAVTSFKDAKECFWNDFRIDKIKYYFQKKWKKISALFGTSNPMDLTMTQLALTIFWR